MRWTTISAQLLRENKTKWRVAPKRKTGAVAKHSLNQTADCTALQSQIDWTMEPLNQKSQIDQEYGLLPADAWQQLVFNNKVVMIYGYAAVVGLWTIIQCMTN